MTSPAGVNRSKLTLLVGTINRLPLLKRCLEQVIEGLEPGYEVIVIDAGSTDGTQTYVRSLGHPKITLREDGKRLGQALSFNRVLKTIQSDYVCWISDDNVLAPSALKTCVSILDQEPKIGMVGLKVKDVNGPWVNAPYIGGVWKSGVLNINQGMVRFDLFRRIGFFDLEYGSYGIDADLTTKILLEGYQVCLTKEVAIFHHRMHEEHPGAFLPIERSRQKSRAQTLYRRKFWLMHCSTTQYVRLLATDWTLALARHRYKWRKHWRYQLWRERTLHFFEHTLGTQFCLRDAQNLILCRWVSPLDLWVNRSKPYYLVQDLGKMRWLLSMTSRRDRERPHLSSAQKANPLSTT